MNGYPEILASSIMETGGELHRSIDESISILSAMVNYDGMEESPENIAGLRGLVDKLRDTEQRIRKQLDAYDGASKKDDQTTTARPLAAVDTCHAHILSLRTAIGGTDDTPDTRAVISALMDAVESDIPTLKASLLKFGLIKKKE